MYQFFVEEQQVSQTKIFITGSDHNHIQNVLRMKPGEQIRVSTTGGKSFFCHIASLDREQVVAEIDGEDREGTELPNGIILFQGLPKGDKMELIIQKSTELGVKEIVPVAMKNCVVKLDAKKADNKQRRWQLIAESAAKQSKRTLIPKIHKPVSWKESLALAARCDVWLVPYENQRGMEATREALRCISPGDQIAMMIGPEGGFAEEEIGSLPEKARRISLGRRILRTETAGMAAMAMLVYELEE